MEEPIEQEIVLNIVWTGRTFGLMRRFTESILGQSTARVRFVANACPADELALLDTYATANRDRVVELLEVSRDEMVAHGTALDRVVEQRDDGPIFAFLDPDILASGPFLDPFLALLSEHDAVTSGTELWSDSNVQPVAHLGAGVGGRHFFSPDGRTYGSPHFGLYQRDPLVETMNRWKVGFGSAGPDLTDEALSHLEEVGLMHQMFDTGKILNLMFQATGHSLVHIEQPALVHIGGLSHYLAPAESAHATSGAEPPWVRNPAVRARADVARHVSRVLTALEGGEAPPPVPEEDDERLGGRLSLASRAILGLEDTVPGTATDHLEDFEARFDAYVETKNLFEIDHTVQVTSFGGTGTTALCQHLMDLDIDVQGGPAHWPFKHVRTPPSIDEVPPDFRVVYLIGDPRNAVVSLFRRSYQLGHARAMNLDWRGARQRRAEGLPHRDPSTPRESRASAVRLSDLDTYLAAGVDEFGFETHLDGWRNHPAGYPVLFARYETIGEHWDQLCDFIGISPDRPAMEVRQRTSDWRILPPHLQGQIDRLYGDLARRIEQLPPVEVI